MTRAERIERAMLALLAAKVTHSGELPATAYGYVAVEELDAAHAAAEAIVEYVDVHADRTPTYAESGAQKGTGRASRSGEAPAGGEHGNPNCDGST